MRDPDQLAHIRICSTNGKTEQRRSPHKCDSFHIAPLARGIAFAPARG